jgi:hypothetical protein
MASGDEPAPNRIGADISGWFGTPSEGALMKRRL